MTMQFTYSISANMWSMLLLITSFVILAHGEGISPRPHISPRGGFVPQSTMYPWHFPRSGPRPTFPENQSRLPAPRGYRQQTTLRPGRMRGLWQPPRHRPRSTFPQHQSRLPAPRGYHHQPLPLTQPYDYPYPPSKEGFEGQANHRVGISSIIKTPAEIFESGTFESECSGE